MRQAEARLPLWLECVGRCLDRAAAGSPVRTLAHSFPAGSGDRRGERECAICLSGPQEAVAIRLTACGHPFCDDCIRKYVAARSRHADHPCPLCRSPLELATLLAAGVDLPGASEACDAQTRLHFSQLAIENAAFSLNIISELPDASDSDGEPGGSRDFAYFAGLFPPPQPEPPTVAVAAPAPSEVA